ncbi:hypothetical protein Lcho_0323 [Leptothrix cholodnii SP-6]|uniref:DUF302 domain-containing protein n=1 Tax=Leptothrix cholodnii (strain ATCC 51168 / LMG 8142 / SP-6) TaxID=395495 RepID=B1XW71_LEPCP|nr:hypothetical protein [Leptothrix cholodnii]ACB32598.1 hypothetical protein Lcho_0323 [Leptothrix cholodnii SP-6]
MVLSSPLHSRPESTSIPREPAARRSREEVAGISMPWRCWLTGCMAVVMLAAGDARAEDFGQDRRQTHYSTTETMARVVASAQARGLSVVARIPMPGQHVEWLVLGPSPDETAVIQHAGDATIDLPLTLQISQTEDGGAEVRFHDASMPGAHSLSDDLRERMDALPGLLDDALAVH